MKADVVSVWLTSMLLGVTGAIHAVADEKDERKDDLVDAPAETVMTVYATADSIEALDFPGQVSVIKRDEIELFNPASMADLFRDIPGVDFNGGPRRTGETPTIRGRGGDSVLILLDGARQSFLSAHDGRFFLDPELVKTAEVVRGPVSSLYGSGAVGGVMAFETIDAADLIDAGEMFATRLKLGYQDVNDDLMASLTAGAQLESWDLLASIQQRQSGDIELGSGATLPAGDDLLSSLLKVTYSVSDDLQTELSWQRFNSDIFEPNNGQGLSIVDDGNPNVFKDITSDNFRFGLNYRPADNPMINTRFTLYSTQTDVAEFDPSLPRNILRDVSTDGLSLINTSELNTGEHQLYWSIGLDWFRDKQIGSDDNNQSGLRGGVPNGETEFTGFFTEFQWLIDNPFGLDGELLVIPGLRYDRFESQSPEFTDINPADSATTPRLAVNYQANSWLGVFASYSEGFRAPSVNELFLNGVHFSVPHPVLFNPAQGQFQFVNNNFIPNPELSPELSINREVGFTLNHTDLLTDSDSWQLKASYYENEVNDLIDLNVAFNFDRSCFAPPFLPCSAGVSSSRNVSQATIEGLELESVYENDDLRFRVAYATMDTENRADGSELGNQLPDRLNFDIRLKWLEQRFELGSRIQLAENFSRQIFDTSLDRLVNSDARNGYGVIDFYARYKPTNDDKWVLTVGLDNAFDKQYARVFEGVFEAGRNIRATLSYTP